MHVCLDKFSLLQNVAVSVNFLQMAWFILGVLRGKKCRSRASCYSRIESSGTVTILKRLEGSEINVRDASELAIEFSFKS